MYSKVCIIAWNTGSIGGKSRSIESSAVRIMTGPLVIPRASPTRNAEDDWYFSFDDWAMCSSIGIIVAATKGEVVV